MVPPRCFHHPSREAQISILRRLQQREPRARHRPEAAWISEILRDQRTEWPWIDHGFMGSNGGFMGFHIFHDDFFSDVYLGWVESNQQQGVYWEYNGI